MIDELTKALGIAVSAHEGQTDKAGKPYILHPLEVAAKQKTYEGVIVALLHDVVEDSEYTIEDLKKEGFPENVIEAVQLLTHEKGVPYADYIKAIYRNKIAKSVKIADLTHNSDLSRLPVVTEKDIERNGKYERALSYLRTGRHL